LRLAKHIHKYVPKNEHVTKTITTLDKENHLPILHSWNFRPFVFLGTVIVTAYDTAIHHFRRNYSANPKGDYRDHIRFPWIAKIVSLVALNNEETGIP